MALPLPLQVYYITIVDDASSTISYVGKAPAGTPTDQPLWQIMRIDTGTSPLTKVFYAGGKPDYTNVWDNRASLTYS